MLLFPAIDLVAGKVVRLERGDRARMRVYSDDPLAVAQRFAQAGARWVHVVDLSATLGEHEDAREANRRAIEQICASSGLLVDVGGGVRDMDAVEWLLSAGAARVALGTALVSNPAFATEAIARLGERAVADVAARDGRVRVNGWRDVGGVALDELLESLAKKGLKHLVFTDVARDGMQTGIDVAGYRQVAALTGFPVIASGGIASLDDVHRLALAGSGVIEGAIVGRALYEGSFTLEEALAQASAGEE